MYSQRRRGLILSARFRLLAEGVIAGGAAGVVVETALYPIDTIKTRLQVMKSLLRCVFCLELLAVQSCIHT